MLYYFISEFPLVIKINGVYGGKIDKTFKKFELTSDSFVEICPLNRMDYPISFMLDSLFLSSPPDGIIITDLKGAFVINIVNISSFSTFSIVAQQKLPFAVATVFKENGLNLSIETPSDFYAERFFIPDCDAVISPFMLNNNQFIAVNFLNEKSLLVCFLIQDKVIKVFSKNICDVCFENGLKTTHKYLDIAKHKLTIEWEYSNGKLSAKNTLIERDENYKIDELIDSVIPYAFLEEFLIGGNVDDFLSHDLKENVDFLKGFFGEYIGVFPPPEFRNLNEIGLIYSKNENLYYAKYFSFETKNKKICNIKRSDSWPFLLYIR